MEVLLDDKDLCSSYEIIKDIIWFCGFYEGEGSISNDKSNNNRLRISISQNDPTPLLRGKNIWGGSILKRERKTITGKISIGYEWRLSHYDSLIFIKDIKPYMKIPYKINQINKAINKLNEKITTLYKCKYCDKDYANPSGRRRHEKSKHPYKISK
jgi:hypothetical protein